MRKPLSPLGIVRSGLCSGFGIWAAQASPEEARMDLDLYGRRGNNVLLVPAPASPLIGQQAVFGQLASQDDIGFVGPSTLYHTYKATITERL